MYRICGLKPLFSVICSGCSTLVSSFADKTEARFIPFLFFFSISINVNNLYFLSGRFQDVLFLFLPLEIWHFSEWPDAWLFSH